MKWWNSLSFDEQEGFIAFSIVAGASIAGLIALYIMGVPWPPIILAAGCCTWMCSLFFGAVRYRG